MARICSALFGPGVNKKNANFINYISVTERLATTPKFLATWDVPVQSHNAVSIANNNTGVRGPNKRSGCLCKGTCSRLRRWNNLIYQGVNEDVIFKILILMCTFHLKYYETK